MVTRRHLLQAVAATTSTALAGCLGRDGEAPSGNGDAVAGGDGPVSATSVSPTRDRHDMKTKRCDIAIDEWLGEAAPIETSATAGDHHTIEANCAQAAAEAAFEALDQRVAPDLYAQEWITPISRGSYRHRAAIFVIAVFEPDGHPRTCPGSAFDPATYRTAIPARVTVELIDDEPDEVHECTHDIRLVTKGVQLHDHVTSRS